MISQLRDDTAGLEFNSLYSDYVRRLQEAERILDQKMGPRGYFTQRMQVCISTDGRDVVCSFPNRKLAHIRRWTVLLGKLITTIFSHSSVRLQRICSSTHSTSKQS